MGGVWKLPIPKSTTYERLNNPSRRAGSGIAPDRSEFQTPIDPCHPARQRSLGGPTCRSNCMENNGRSVSFSGVLGHLRTFGVQVLTWRSNVGNAGFISVAITHL